MSIHCHYIMHKPPGYVSQFVFNQTKRKNKKLLGDLYTFPEGTMAIGRLDKQSEGLLLLTTDGKMSDRIRSKEIEKEYYAEVDGDVTDDKIEQLRTGVPISIYGKPYVTLPSEVRLLGHSELINVPIDPNEFKRHRPTAWLSIIVKEGKFRQVRKMTAAVGLPTMRLVRVRVGEVQLGTLEAGQVSQLELNHYFK